MTHPLDQWLEALPDGGRLMVPLTVQMQPTIGKGFMMLLTRDADASFTVRPVGMVAIYSAVGLRDEQLNAALGQVIMKHAWPPVRRLRRDPHEASSSCWFHSARFCFAS